MKALGAALVCTCITLWSPASARADPIRGGMAAADCRLNAPLGGPALHDADADDVALTPRGSLERSVHFAADGFIAQFFTDERTSLRHVADVEGLERRLQDHLADLLDKDKHKDKNDKHEPRGRRPNDRPNAPGAPRVGAPAAPDPSPTPEPASMFLLGTGLAGLFRYRRQLFA